MKLNRLFPSRNRWLWVTIYVLYIVFILITTTAYYAEQNIQTRSRGTHEYLIMFDKDNLEVEHYKVELVDNSQPGKIWVLAQIETNRNQLTVETLNIQKLEVDCNSIAREKNKEILGVDYEDHENAYKQYFIEKNLFTVSAYVDHDVELTLKDVPYPSKVVVNGEVWPEGSEGKYTYSNGNIVTTVINGNNIVDIEFKDSSHDLQADFKTNNKDFFHIPDKWITFDASSSSPIVDIEDFLWDFGDGTYGDGIKAAHKYEADGNYEAILVVRDGAGLISRRNHTIFVHDEDSDNLPDNWETKYLSNLQWLGGADNDKDGLDNLEEYLNNTNPNNEDTDGDNFKDGYEVDQGTDPLDNLDKPDKEKEKEEEDGILGLGKIMGIDIFLLIIMILIIIIIILAAIMRRRDRAEGMVKKQVKEEEDEDEEEEEDEEEVFQCPECGIEIEEDVYECSECGAILEWEEEELEDVDIEPESTHKKKNGIKGNGKLVDIEDKVKDESFECPTCGAEVDANDMICPNCEEEFV